MSLHRRFGIGVTSLPLSVRLGVTVPVVLLEILMLRALISNASSDDPRPAAFNLFAIGVLAFVATPFLRELWRSSAEWSRERNAYAADLRNEADRVRIRDGVPHLEPLRPEGSELTPRDRAAGS